METLVIKQLRGRDPAELEDLLLEGIKAPQIAGIDDKFVNLKTLSLIGVGLQSLENFPSLPNLRKLILADNKISGGLQALANAGLPQLVLLDLSNNRISKIDALAPLKSFPNLKHLDLGECEVSNTPGFTEAVFKLIPSLQTLNNADAEGNEVDIESDFDGEEGEEDEDEEGEEEEEGEEGDEEEDEGDEEEGDEEAGAEAAQQEKPRQASRKTAVRSTNPEEDEEEEEGEEEDDDEEEGFDEDNTTFDDQFGLEMLQKDDLQDDESDGEYEPFDHRHSTLAREEEDARLEAELDEEEAEEEEEEANELKRPREDDEGGEFSNKFLKED